MFTEANAEARFWAKLDRSTACWLWPGHVNPNGHATFRSPYFAEQWVHRIAWTLARGPIPRGVEVCHRCDVGICCNPAHLFLGTHAENQRDMATKGRAARGRRVAGAKLTESDVLSIRRRAAEGESIAALAVDFRISKSHTWRIVAGKEWAWLVAS